MEVDAPETDETAMEIDPPGTNAASGVDKSMPNKPSRARQPIPADVEIIDVDSLPDREDVQILELVPAMVKREPKETVVKKEPGTKFEPFATWLNTAEDPIVIDDEEQSTPATAANVTSVAKPADVDLGESSLRTPKKVLVSDEYKKDLRSIQQHWFKKLANEAGPSAARQDSEAETEDDDELEYEISDEEDKKAQKEYACVESYLVQN